MVEVIVDPGADRLFDVGKVEYHAAIVELGAFDRNHRTTIVAMQMAALAVVVEQAVAVTEVDFAGNSEHFFGLSHRIKGVSAVGNDERGGKDPQATSKAPQYKPPTLTWQSMQ